MPDVMVAADMSEHIMTAKKKERHRTIIHSEWTFLERKKKGGLVMGIYVSNRTGEYCVVNKGTTLTNLNNWKNNIQQPLGSSADMKRSISIANKFVKKIKKKKYGKSKEITFVGHSKGGAEAAANAVATNKNCITFNPAAVNYKKYNLNPSRYTAQMTTYIVKGDILNTIESGFRGFAGRII